MEGRAEPRELASESMDTRNYLLKENEIYKKAPVKRFSVCTWIAEWLFGLWSVCCYERLFF
ncbi:uncharacterized protein [Blastocystis hominis]|uniref:Uncharacterized protein n=1 Tax=Blastocystis hominis TaxID=12968 RepID=D8M3S9_BLAHO|nr:uncharacterized protein [Blastocystis hominis]CBK22552.2 unnamed protein product [Blastocystis hominis]|eukprot:XP_012896600.1 uncharacterized protein [Blastocystis hominis]